MGEQILKPCPFCGKQPRRRESSGDERNSYADWVGYECACGCSKGARGSTDKPGYADNSKIEERALIAWNTRAQPASAPKPCCTPSAEELALLQSGDYTPEELWGGREPTCPKCIDAKNAAAFTRPAPAGVVDMLRRALPFLEQHNDEGPAGEGWKSDELIDLVRAITVELNGAPK